MRTAFIILAMTSGTAFAAEPTPAERRELIELSESLIGCSAYAAAMYSCVKGYDPEFEAKFEADFETYLTLAGTVSEAAGLSYEAFTIKMDVAGQSVRSAIDNDCTNKVILISAHEQVCLAHAQSLDFLLAE